MHLYNMKHWFLIVSTFLCTSTLVAKTTEEINNTAINYYKQENYKEAISWWNQLIPVESTDRSILFQNIGNSFFKMKEYSRAVLYYEKSLKYNFNNTKSHTNLSIAKAKLKLDTDSKELFFIVWANKFIYLFSYDFLRISMVVLAWCALFFSGGYVFSKNEILKKAAMYSLIFIGIGLIWIFILEKTINNSSNAILMTKTPICYEESTLKGKSKVLLQGDKVQVLDQYSHYIQIELIDNTKWWIDAKELKII